MERGWPATNSCAAGHLRCIDTPRRPSQRCELLAVWLKSHADGSFHTKGWRPLCTLSRR